MANRGFDESDDRFGDRDYGTDQRRTATPGAVLKVAGRTSVGEQIRAGGFARSDRPQGDDDSAPPPHKYQGGSANDRGHAVADYPGSSSGP